MKLKIIKVNLLEIHFSYTPSYSDSQTLWISSCCRSLIGSTTGPFLRSIRCGYPKRKTMFIGNIEVDDEIMDRVYMWAFSLTAVIFSFWIESIIFNREFCWLQRGKNRVKISFYFIFIKYSNMWTKFSIHKS